MAESRDWITAHPLFPQKMTAGGYHPMPSGGFNNVWNFQAYSLSPTPASTNRPGYLFESTEI
jgi:hypothetical protein